YSYLHFSSFLFLFLCRGMWNDSVWYSCSLVLCQQKRNGWNEEENRTQATFRDKGTWLDLKGKKASKAKRKQANQCTLVAVSVEESYNTDFCRMHIVVLNTFDQDKKNQYL
uniref:Uncharacterized protein n=1 Tax=Poecilia reticulata TaxID=8081 RepID=A0A3P9NBN7_POERE